MVAPDHWEAEAGGRTRIGGQSKTTRLRWILALHAVAGAIAICYAMWSLISNDVVTGKRGYHLLGSAALLLLWLWVWSVAVRTCPRAESTDQSEHPLQGVPVSAVIAIQAGLTAYFVTADSPLWEGSFLLLVTDFVLFTSLLIGGISWGLAGIRFSVATWLLACGATGAGLIGVIYVVGNRLVNAG